MAQKLKLTPHDLPKEIEKFLAVPHLPNHQWGGEIKLLIEHSNAGAARNIYPRRPRHPRPHQRPSQSLGTMQAAHPRGGWN